MMKGIESSYLKVLLLISVAMTVIASGCVSPMGGGSAGPGIAIEKFEPSLTQVESNEPVTLHLELRNKGEYNGPLSNGVPVVAELMGVDTTEWMVLPSVYSQPMYLFAPDLESQTEGGLGTWNWELTTPMLARGQRLTYSPIARAYYVYETDVIKPVWFVTKNELETIVRSGGALSSEATSYTSGPITVDVKTGNFVSSREWMDSKFQVQIKISNTGSGNVFGKERPIGVYMEWPSFVTPIGGNCPKEIDWSAGYSDILPIGLTPPTTLGNFVKLWDTKETDITCEFMIVEPPSSRTKANFHVKLSYIYYIDQSTQITVKGVEDFI